MFELDIKYLIHKKAVTGSEFSLAFSNYEDSRVVHKIFQPFFLDWTTYSRSLIKFKVLVLWSLNVS